jgi:hypothetical protein
MLSEEDFQNGTTNTEKKTKTRTACISSAWMHKQNVIPSYTVEPKRRDMSDSDEDSSSEEEDEEKTCGSGYDVGYQKKAMKIIVKK